jgi:hypothetical protein
MVIKKSNKKEEKTIKHQVRKVKKMVGKKLDKMQ